MHPFLDAFQAQASGGQPGGGGALMQLLPIVAIFGVFYFLVIRPQQKQRKKHEDYISSLKRGDEVVTQGGLIGEIVSVEDRVVTLNVGGGTKVRLLKGQVMGAWSEAPAAGGKVEEKK